MKTSTEIFKNILSTKTALTATTVLMGALVTGQAQAKALKADFNKDGVDDMVVGMPDESIGGLTRAGAVKVVYGRTDGTWRTHSKTAYLHQTKNTEAGINLFGVMEAYDRFGASIAVGDFNKDGYDDLAMGAPDESIGSQHRNVGMVNIAYGSPNGLGTPKNHQLNLKRYKSGEYLHDYNRFGTALTVGDYDGDGVDDLAVGFAGKTTANKFYTGGVVVFFGKAAVGLHNAETSPKTYIMLDYRSRSSIKYGTKLASGDLDNDGFDDLVIGAYEDTTSSMKTGSVYIGYGHDNWEQNHPRWNKIVPQVKNDESQFGYALAVGDFDRDRRDELAIGMPGYNSDGKSKSGAVVMVNVKPNGTLVQRYLYQGLNQIPGSSQKGEHFGDALAAADFDNDGYDDLAVGIPYKSKNSYWSWKRIIGYGEVVVLYGDRYDFDFPRSQVWHQDTAGIEGGREDGDFFGDSLSSGDFNNDGVADLLVGVTNEAIGSTKYAGVVQFIWGRRTNGLTANIPGKQLFHQGSFSSAGFGASENERLDKFGTVLAP